MDNSGAGKAAIFFDRNDQILGLDLGKCGGKIAIGVSPRVIVPPFGQKQDEIIRVLRDEWPSA